MIIIHQAIYGENSGHALLKSSDLQSGIADRVSGYTDLNDRPEGGVLEEAVVRGLFIENHFLLIKTFPDLTPGMRRGRVFSHALFLDTESFFKLNNICDLFQFFLTSIDKKAKMEPINYHNLPKDSYISSIDEREAAGINSILKHEIYNNCIVWIGEKGYWEWIGHIWKPLPFKTKMSLKIGAAFNPQNVKAEYLNLVYTPSDLKTNWSRHSCKLIDVNESEELSHPVAWRLVGNSQQASFITDLISDFELTINTISDLSQIYDIGKVYQQIDQKPAFTELLVLSDFISRANPNSSSGQKGKRKLLDSIVKTLPNTNVQMFTALMYQSWKGFTNAIDTLKTSLNDWLESNLFSASKSKEIGGMVLSALNAQKGNWWTKIILDFVYGKLEKPQKNHIDIVWQWMIISPSLIRLHKNWLPEELESQLSENVPKLHEDIAKEILLMAREKKWFLLHGIVISKLYDPLKAISEHLLIDTDQANIAPLEAMAKNIKAKDFIDASVYLNENRLYMIAGKIVGMQPDLLQGIKIEEKGWQIIWEESIKANQSVWGGFQEPQKVLFRIIDNVVAGKTFKIDLLERISKSEVASLKLYPNRGKVWQYLPANCRSNFIFATASDCIIDIANGESELKGFEQELIAILQLDQLTKATIEKSTLLVSSKIRLLRTFTNLDASVAQILVEKNNFIKEDAQSFGKLVQGRNWKSLANYLYNNYNQRSDLLPALLECTSLLSHLQKIDLSLRNVKKDAISKEEIWNLLLEKACDLYSEGPMKNGLWEIAGGKKSDLYQSGTGKTIWSYALSHIRAGGKPKIQDLIDAMLKEFPSDETLKKIKQTV